MNRYSSTSSTLSRQWLPRWNECIRIRDSQRRQNLTTSCFRPPSWILGWRNHQLKLALGLLKSLSPMQNMVIAVGILSLGGTEPEIYMGVIYPPPNCNVRKLCKNTIATWGLISELLLQTDDKFVFSYPQCRLCLKNTPRRFSCNLSKQRSFLIIYGKMIT